MYLKLKEIKIQQISGLQKVKLPMKAFLLYGKHNHKSLFNTQPLQGLIKRMQGMIVFYQL